MFIALLGPNLMSVVTPPDPTPNITIAFGAGAPGTQDIVCTLTSPPTGYSLRLYQGDFIFIPVDTISSPLDTFSGASISYASGNNVFYVGMLDSMMSLVATSNVINVVI